MNSRQSRRTFLKQTAFLGASAAAGAALAACSTPMANPTAMAVQTQAAQAGAAAVATAPPEGAAKQVMACNGMPLGDAGVTATLEIWSWATEALSVVNDAFTELYPNVTCNYTNLPHADVHDKASVAIAAGTGAPDVFSIDGALLQRFIKAGGLLSMDETISTCKKDFPAYKIAEATGTDGKMYAVPWDMGPMGLYHRKSLWEEKGLAVPTTWEDYIAHGVEFAKEQHYMTEMPLSGSAFNFDTLLQQLGGSYFAEDGSVTVDDERGLEAMSMVEKMFKAGITADISQWSPGWFAAWKEGTLITSWGAAWMGHVFPDNIKEGEPTFGDWRIAPLPAFEAGGATSSNAGGSNLVVPAQTKNQAAAVAFVTYAVASIEGQVAGTLAGNISAYLPALRDPRVVNATNPIYGDQKYFALFADLSEQVPTKFLRLAPYTEATGAITEVVAKLLAGDLDAAAAVQEAGQKVRDIAQKYEV